MAEVLRCYPAIAEPKGKEEEQDEEAEEEREREREGVRPACLSVMHETLRVVGILQISEWLRPSVLPPRVASFFPLEERPVLLCPRLSSSSASSSLSSSLLRCVSFCVQLHEGITRGRQMLQALECQRKQVVREKKEGRRARSGLFAWMDSLFLLS